MEYATIYCSECGHAEYVSPRHAEEVSVCFVWPEPYNAMLYR